jgi:hypothetical protein
MVDFKEALLALRALALPMLDCGELPADKAALVGCVVLALEAAQQEADAWRSVWDWMQLRDSGNVNLWASGTSAVVSKSRLWVTLYHSDDASKLFETVTDDPAEALAKAATWCRAQVPSAETGGCSCHVIDMRGCTKCDLKHGRVRT